MSLDPSWVTGDPLMPHPAVDEQDVRLVEQGPQSLFDQNHAKIAFVHRIVDAVVIMLALRVSAASYSIEWNERYVIAGVLAMILFYLFGESVRLYRSRRGAPARELLRPVVFAWVSAGLALIVVAWMTKTTADYSRVTIGLWMIFTPLILILWRAALRSLLRVLRAQSQNARRVAIAGANEHGERLAEVVTSTPSLGLRLIGYFDDRRAEEGQRNQDLPAPFSGDFNALVEQARAGQLDLIYITLPMKAEEQISRLIDRLSDTPAAVYIAPNFFIYDLLHSRWANVGSIPTISVFESPFLGIEGWTKRLEDVVLSIFILIIAAVPMLVIAGAIRVSSPGPVTFKQRRYGLDGREFMMWKFRTMTVGEDGENVVQARKEDDRVTSLGAFLRHTSLDELPQFFNVLCGDMSIVGPRPHAVAHNEKYRKLISGYMLRHKVKPGITGWAQINGWRGETDTIDKMERRIQFDLWYIRSWSVWLDLRIIARTALRGFVDKNAY